MAHINHFWVALTAFIPAQLETTLIMQLTNAKLATPVAKHAMLMRIIVLIVLQVFIISIMCVIVIALSTISKILREIVSGVTIIALHVMFPPQTVLLVRHLALMRHFLMENHVSLIVVALLERFLTLLFMNVRLVTLAVRLVKLALIIVLHALVFFTILTIFAILTAQQAITRALPTIALLVMISAKNAI